MLIRTADIGFQYSLPKEVTKGTREQRKSQDPADTFLPKIEEQYLVLLSYLMRANMTTKERDDMKKASEGKEAQILQRKIFLNCGATRKEVGQYGYNIANKVSSQMS